MVLKTHLAPALIAASLFAAGCAHRDRVPHGTPTAAPEGEGWLDLLDEEHEPHWRNVTDDRDIFSIEDGVLHIPGRIYPLRYVAYMGQTFSDFELHVEFRVGRRANSGVFLRSQPRDPVSRGFEVQVLDDHGDPPSKKGSGAIYDVVTPMFNMARPAGEWNSYDISVRGKEVKVVMNGWLVIHTDFSKMTMPIGKFDTPYAELPLEGHIMLQDHGGEVWYRNIRVKPL